MKWLKDDAYNAMSVAANNWNTLVQKVLEGNPDMKAEDVTPEMMLEAMESAGDDQQEELKNELNEAKNDIQSKDAEIEKLKSENAALKVTPKGGKKDVKADGEPLGDAEDIKEYSEKNSGDTIAIMAKAEETGFFNY